ncbi:YeiH family protein [Halodurantibacterium flavum]|uniref:YeiH family protein n=1 Tax=Halodurantibacterium flavum TaxID=1382802 RepID=A0ABW4S1R9_9RHOB
MIQHIPARIAPLRGGVIVALTIALAASFLAEHYGAPAMLYALLIGMAFNFLAAQPAMAPGIAFSSGTLLRVGVALLGLRLTFEDVSTLGALPVLGVVALLVTTILGGAALARAMGYPTAFGLLSAGAVAICGASAALAIAAVLARRVREEDVLLTVVAVTSFSTVAMVAYPVIFSTLGLSEVQSGYLIGATIHDVAQVVGAGYSLGESAGDIATFTKLLRVAMLPLVLVAIALWQRGSPGEEGGQRAGLPWFVGAFLVLMILRNLLPIPEPVLTAASDGARFLLLVAIAALGTRTSLGGMLSAGSRRFAVIAAQSGALLFMALGLVALGIV